MITYKQDVDHLQLRTNIWLDVFSDSPHKGMVRPFPSDDYYEPPDENGISRLSSFSSSTMECHPQRPGLVRSGHSDHTGMYSFSTMQMAKDTDSDHNRRGSFESFKSPMQWVSPMLLRRYMKASSPESPQSPKERRGMFSSPFVKRKSSVDSKQWSPDPGIRIGSMQRQMSADNYGHMSGHMIGHMTRHVPSNGTAVRAEVHHYPHDFFNHRNNKLKKSGSYQEILELTREEHPKFDSRSLGGLETKLEASRHIELDNDSPTQPSNGFQNTSMSEIDSHETIPEESIRVTVDKTHKTTVVIETCDNVSFESPTIYAKSEIGPELKVELTRNQRDSPDLGVEDTSPTGTLDSTASEDFKDSKYGSSSTMSVGSDASPITERKGRRHRPHIAKPQVGTL